MFERLSEPILPFRQWLRRIAWTSILASMLVGAALGIGTVGYHRFAGLSWLDATLNAAMILTGMGPVDYLTAPSAKIFAIVYALFSSLVFLGTAGLLVAPWLHRLLHTLHAEDDESS